MLTCDQSTSVLVDLLIRNEFESGSHLDYYDVVNTKEIKTDDSLLESNEVET